MSQDKKEMEEALHLFRYFVWFGQNTEGTARRLVKYSLWGVL